MHQKRDFWPLLFLFLAVCWFAGDMIWDDKLPFFRDLGPYFYPRRFSVAQSFHAGELPLWERHSAMGFPLLADFQSAAFYLPHALLAITPFFTALRMLFVFHYAIAALGAYKLCRNWEYPPTLAIVGALCFTLGGTLVSLTNLLNHFQAAVWLPWVILCGERAARTGSWRTFVGLVAVLLLQFLSGSPEIYAMTLALVFIDLIRLRADPAAPLKRALLIFVAANLVVTALSMVQLLPTIELIGESRTRRAMSLVEAAAWSLRPVELINLFFPDKRIELALARPLRPFFTDDVPFLASHYLGVLALFGIVCWTWYAPRREKLAITSMLALSLLLALGDYTPIYPLLLRYIPVFNLFRFPEKFFFLTYALLLFIALRGAREAFRPTGGNAGVLIAGSIVLLFASFYAAFRLNTAPLTGFISWTRGSLTFSALEIATLVLTRLEMQIALSFGLFIVIAGKRFGFLRDSLFSVLMIVFVLVDLGSVHRPMQLLVKPDFIKKSSLILPEPPAEHARLFYKPAGDNLHPSRFFFTKAATFSEFNSMVFDNLLPDTGIFYGFDSMQEIDALGRWPYTTFLLVANELPPEGLYRLLGALNVEYVVSFFPLETHGIVLERQFPRLSSWLYRIPSVTPRAYIVNRASVDLNRFSILKRLASGEFKPLEEAILEHAVELTPAATFHGAVNIERYQDQTIALRASLNAPGVLVLADSFYPGWRVYVDGKEQEILRANLFFRGVQLTAGEHRVEFRYEPGSFTIGAMISLVSLVVVVAVSLVMTLKNRRSTAS